MRRHHMSRGIGIALLVACASWITSASLRALPQAKAQDFSGGWQLNESASTNPGGPMPATPGQGGSGGGRQGGGSGGGRGGGGAADKISSGPPPGGDLGPEEQSRVRAELKLVQAAPQKLTIQAAAKEFNLTYEGGGSQSAVTFPNVEGKKAKITAVAAFEKLKMEAKAQWSGGMFKREITTPESLTVIEEYTLSADGKQLTVVVTAKCGMWRIPEPINPPVKRVYDRVQ